MATPNKKFKKSPLLEAASEISKLDTTYRMTTTEDLHEFYHEMTIGLQACAGVIGTEEEEEYYKNLPEVGSAEIKVDADVQVQHTTGADDVDQDREATESAHSEREEDIDGVEPAAGKTIVVMPDGGVMAVSQYYGSEWEHMITELHSVEPLPVDPHMPTTPHDYQRKGAAQINHACNGPFKGILIGDPMGLGKTLQAISSMKVIADQPGIILVLCPASLCRQWVQSIESAFEEGHGLSALHLDTPAISAHAILAGGYDVVVCSYEFAEANYKKKIKYENAVEAWTEIGDRDAVKPKKPTTALATGLWALTEIYIKRGYMDEVQVVNKRDGERHKAIMQLKVSSWCMMSGTLAHNRWHDISGYLDFLKGHLYTTDDKFLSQFTSPNYSGTSNREIRGSEMYLLQRFLQAFIVMRPRDVLTLPPCHRVAFPVELTESQAGTVMELTALYKQCCGMDSDTGPVDLQGMDEASALGMAIRAQLHGLHPRLAPEGKKDDFQPDQEDIANSTAEELNQKYTGEDPNAAEKRRKWLEELNEWEPEVFYESPHVKALTGFLAYMVEKCPESKLVVMSQYLKYLDIVDRFMLMRYNVKCLRYDGTVGQAQRVLVQKEFSRADLPRPLLMTAGAGSVGLNLTSGKVVVLAEEWWNYSTEAQAISRCWRQGAEGEVNVVKFHIHNSAIDAEIARVRRSKVQTNEALMKPLIHKHDEIPKPVELLY